MGTWNYRLIRLNEEDVVIAEVYYNDDGLPVGFSARSAGGPTVSEIEETLDRMRAALYKSVLRLEGGEKLVDTREMLEHSTLAQEGEDAEAAGGDDGDAGDHQAQRRGDGDGEPAAG